MNVSVDPTKATFLVRMRVVDPRNLVGRREEIALNEHVMLRKKNSKPGVGVVPADDSLVGIGLILDAINRLPRVLGEGDMGTGLSGIRRLDGSAYFNHAVVLIADQHPADFRRHMRACM